MSTRATFARCPSDRSIEVGWRSAPCQCFYLIGRGCDASRCWFPTARVHRIPTGLRVHRGVHHVGRSIANDRWILERSVGLLLPGWLPKNSALSVAILRAEIGRAHV